MNNPEVAYDELPLLPPAEDVESKLVLKKCITARAEMAALKQAAERLPYQGVLINVLPVLEAQSSSEIENIVTTTDELFRGANNEETQDPELKEALNYRVALKAGFDMLKEIPLTTSIAETVCSRIKSVDMRVRSVPGTRLVNDSTGQVIYTPPVGEDLIRGKLANWEQFLHEETEGSLDPLVRLAVAHYQFEAIHPFTDGNGRTGRIINLLYLVEKELLSQPILYHSRAILNRKEEYYRLITAVTRRQEWEPWILYMLEILEDSAKWTTNKINGVIELQYHTQEYLREHHKAAYQKDLLELIFEMPYCRIANIVESGALQRQAAGRYLNHLVKAGVLVEEKIGREKLFVHKEYLKILYKTANDFDRYM